VLQAAGGALSAWYASREEMPDNGNFTMMGGLSFQAFTLMVFLGLSADFAIRTLKAVRRHGTTALNADASSRRLRRSKRFRAMLFSLAFSALLIFARSVYRVIEISEGWKGELMTTEKFVIWLEAIPVAVSGAFLCVFHPANCFKQDQVPVQEEEQFEMPDTPPSVSSVPQAFEPEKLHDVRDGSRYGSIHVTVDPTFDRKNWR
jgi:hypothetical protein